MSEMNKIYFLNCLDTTRHIYVVDVFKILDRSRPVKTRQEQFRASQPISGCVSNLDFS